MSVSEPYVDRRHPFEVTHDLCSYDFPLSTGGFARLVLPRVVTEDDAKALARFLQIVCIDRATENA